MESSTRDEIKQMLVQGDAAREKLRELLSSIHPADIADLLEYLAEEERKQLFSMLPAEIASETLAEIEETHQEDLIKSLDDESLHEVFEELSDDDATDIVQELSEKEAERVLRVIDEEDLEDIQTLMKYGPETAGGVMTTELVSIRMGLTAEQAIAEVRRQGREIQYFFTVYVVNDKNVLQGTLSFTDLILADPDIPISRIMNQEVISVHPEVDQEEVSQLIARYNIVSIPVVDRGGHLLGRVTVDDVIDIIEEERTEDLMRMSGVDDAESVDQAGLFRSVRSRLPWLCLNLGFIFISAKIIGLFLEVLEKEVILAMFMPVVAGIGGNTSTQSLAVTLRRLIMDSSLGGRKWRVILKEGTVGLINGFAICLLVGLMVFLFSSKLQIALLVAFAAWVSMTMASLMGAVIPIILKGIGFDPAVSSTVITNFTDILSFFLLLGLGTLLLVG